MFQPDLRRQFIAEGIEGILVLTVRIQVSQVISQLHRPTFNISHKQPRRFKCGGSGGADGSCKPSILHLTALQPSHQTSDVVGGRTSHFSLHIGIVYFRLIDISGNAAHIPF